MQLNFGWHVHFLLSVQKLVVQYFVDSPKKNPAKRTKNAAHAQKQRYVYGVKKKNIKDPAESNYKIAHTGSTMSIHTRWNTFMNHILCILVTAGGIRNRLSKMLILGFLFSHNKALFTAVTQRMTSSSLSCWKQNWSYGHHKAQAPKPIPDPIRSVGAPSCSDGCMWEWVEWLMYGYIMFGLRISSAEQRKLSLFFNVASAEMLQLSSANSWPLHGLEKAFWWISLKRSLTTSNRFYIF